MSDSKKDLTRIEDLGEYLHQLDDDEDYLPDLPDESEPPSFMEETQITENPFQTSEESGGEIFESEISDFGSETDFTSEENSDSSTFGESTDFSGDSFSSENSFESSSEFGESSDFSADSDSFTTEDTDFSSGDFSSSENDFSTENNDFSAEGPEFGSESSFELNNDTFETNDFNNESELSFSSEPPLETPTETKTSDTELNDFTIKSTTEPVFEKVNVPEETFEKTPLPQKETTQIYKAPENFEELKKFAENASFTGMATEGNPSYSVLIKDIKFLEDAQDILTLLKELGLAMDSDEVLQKRLMRGEFLVPRISEFAATMLAHKLRRFDIDILVGPSDQIQPPKNGQEPEIGLVSKHNLYQNQSHHFQFEDFNLDISQVVISATPTLDGYQVIKYIGVATEHKMLEGYLVEDENSLEISTHYQELAQKLKAHALKNHANAVVGINYQLTPLPSQFGTANTRYRLTCTGNLVWINRL